MRKGILLSLLTFVVSCQIISRPIQTTYSPIGAFESFLISWKPLQDVCSTCLLEITFPETIHLTSTPLTYSLSDESGVSYLQNFALLAPTSNVYYFSMNQPLKANVWYQISIYPTKAPILVYGLISIQVVSGISSPFISYLSNKAFQYYHLEPVSLPPLNLVLSTVSSASTQASQMFPYQINFNSNVAYNEQVLINFFFSNQVYSSLTISTPLLQNDNFNFVGSCSLICSLVSCINPLSCTIQDNQLQLVLPYLAAATTYTIQFTVLNPNFVDSTGVAAEVQSNNALISGIGILNNLFTVNSIAISAAGVNLHWGIPLNIVQNTMGLGIFVNGGWNNIDIGFMINQITMIGTQFVVEVHVGALSVLEQSINTNLPSLAGTSSMRCVYIVPYIKCSPVDAFTSVALRYFIKFKAYFASTDNIAALGSVRISILNSNNALFTDLTQALAINKIAWSDYHDYSGFHNSNFKIKETQVIGTADTGLTNATSTFMNNFYASNSSFVGIDPQIGNQQLIFLLKTLPSQMSLGIANEKYQMRVYTNPQIFASLGTQGLDVTAFDQNSNSYRGDSMSCYINSSTSPTIQIYQCQTFKDYVYGAQIDNTYTNAAHYGMYSFVCGTGNVVVCPSGQSCAQSCRIFKGKDSLSGYSGVFSIRNVNFIPGYQSSHLADQKSLDFIIAFYHGGAFVSASLINAYTIKQARLSSLRLNFYNTYLNSNTTNDGSRIPNLLSLTGNLSISEISGIYYDQFALFLPQQASVRKYIQPSGRVGCSHSCTSNSNYNSMVTCQDNWICKQRISIKGIINLDSSINFKIPIQITNTIGGSFDLALLSSGAIIRIYRLHGSAITDPISPASTPIISVASYTNPWISTSYWTKTVSDTYKQGLNLNSLIQFGSSNTIDMLGSSLTYTGAPSLTFTSVSINIFSSYTTALGNNVLCDQPFSYVYNSLYSVNVLWCPLINSGINQVVINYPFYSGQLGAGFPFQTVFAFGLSQGTGNLIAYRTESNSKTSKDVCITTHTNSFNYGDVIQQLVNLTLSIQPITISSGQYPTLQLAISIPIQVPVNFVQCSVTQTLINQNIVCSIISIISNVGTLQLSSPDPLTIMSLRINLWLLISAAVTVVPLNTYYYTVEVKLPQSDGSGNAAIYGTTYSPFSSTIASCSYTFNLINSPATNQPIIINNISTTAISLGYLADLSFNIKFSIARPNIISSSEIDIQFVNAITTSTTTCSLWSPQNYIFLQEIIVASGVRLRPLALDTLLSYSTYLITCKNIVLQQNAISLSAQWIDGANILQKSSITPFTLSLPTSTSISGTLVSKNYNTLGYESQYKLTLNLLTNANDRVDIWFDVASNQIHNMVLECYYLSYGLNLQAYCTNDWQGKIHIILTAVLATNIDFSIYGIRQGSVGATSYKVLVSINSLQYYTSTITDSILPNVISAQPIIIKDESVDSSYCLSIVLAFPLAYSSSFYLQLDDTVIKSIPDTVTCSIDGSFQTCSRAAPNLLLFTSTFSFSANSDHLLSVCIVIPTKLDIIDNEQIHFKLFTMSGSNINMGSYEISLSPYYLWNLPIFPLSNLIWSEANFNTSWLYHTIYIGYYKNPVFLSQFNASIYNSNFLLSSTSFNSYSYTNVTDNVLMGTSSCMLDLAASGFNTGMIDYLLVSHPSPTYEQPPPLPLFISSDKCVITPEYPLYETYPGGITLPIILDFSNCRPAAAHYFAYSISSTELAVDASLTNFKINSTNPQAYIFVRQMPTNMLLSGSFILQIQFSGPYSSSFIVSPTINLRVNTGSILQIPQSLPPVISYQNNSFVNFTLQCNQPSTIYWALGFYPTILTITYEVIQGQLINGQEGIRSRVYDPYSWSEEIYGIDYEYYSNKNKTLVIDNLIGNSNYIFKYFCVNQLGFPSGGQIVNFTTGSTNYGLNKVELRLSKLLTIGQANLLAFYIAEVVRTPYSTVTTSTFSNCLNTSLVYYPTATTIYFDYQVGSLYSYYFYIDSLTVITPDILSILPQNLSIYSSYIKNIPPYSFISISPLINAYDPIAASSSFLISSSVVSCTVNVGVVSSYLILAYMSKVFDPLTMTIPPQYMIKQGNFSAISQFNQVYMKYGNNNITINITGLKQYQNYSIFYFVTVDNPALNSKPTKVYYYNIQTPAYITYDLFSKHTEIFMCLFFVIVSIVL